MPAAPWEPDFDVFDWHISAARRKPAITSVLCLRSQWTKQKLPELAFELLSLIISFTEATPRSWIDPESPHIAVCHVENKITVLSGSFAAFSVLINPPISATDTTPQTFAVQLYAHYLGALTHGVFLFGLTHRSKWAAREYHRSLFYINSDGNVLSRLPPTKDADGAVVNIDPEEGYYQEESHGILSLPVWATKNEVVKWTVDVLRRQVTICTSDDIVHVVPVSHHLWDAIRQADTDHIHVFCTLNHDQDSAVLLQS
eukprot:TRINITY_DN61146_c0_g1_i1.p1 TRINITY_DN61146_c0_g1~~TRINITY_DN61146_c0_g1_i1.p1  ORF type:complete len:257 (-),score=33.31 TRINITY_DN61146_c0_g1_i1:28-798(-)